MFIPVTVSRKANPMLRETVRTTGPAHTWNHLGVVNAFRGAFRARNPECEMVRDAPYP